MKCKTEIIIRADIVPGQARPLSTLRRPLWMSIRLGLPANNVVQRGLFKYTITKICFNTRGILP